MESTRAHRTRLGTYWLGALLPAALFDARAWPEGGGILAALTILFGAAALGSLALFPGLILFTLGRSQVAKLRWAALPPLIVLSLAAGQLTRGAAIRNWSGTPALRVLIAVVALASWWWLVPRLSRLGALRWGLLSALAGATGFAAHAFVFPGLYPAFHVAAILVGLQGFALAAAAIAGTGRRFALGALLVGALCLGLLFSGLFPGKFLALRTLLFADAPMAREILPRFSPWLPPEAPVADDAGDIVEAILDRVPLPTATLDEQLPGRKDWSVLLVTIDALRADHTGLSQEGRSSTPELDRFARGATVFTEAQATFPVTLASTYSLLTGRYPIQLALPRPATAIARRAQDAGHRTGAILAFNRDLFADTWPIRGGFDNFEIAARPAAAVTDRGLSWWEAEADRPRFLWLHYFDVHAPYRPLPPDIAADGGSQGERYRGEVGTVDREFGRLIEALRKRGDLERTIVVVHADHGVELGERGGFGQTPALHRESIAVPFLLAVPGREGKRVSGPVDLTTVTPTLAEILGWPADPFAHGNSLASHLLDEVSPIHHPPAFGFAVWRNTLGWGRDWDMLIEGEWKLLVDRQAEISRLFRVSDDINEKRDLAPQEPMQRRRMRQRLERLRSWIGQAEPRSAAARGQGGAQVESPLVRLRDTLDLPTRIHRDSFTPTSGQKDRARARDALDRALLLDADASQRERALAWVAYTSDLLPELSSTCTSMLRDSNPATRRAAAAALLVRIDPQNKEKAPADLLTAAPDLCAGWFGPASTMKEGLSSTAQLLASGGASEGSMSHLLPQCLSWEVLDDPLRALLIARLRTRRDFAALAARYWSALQPPAHPGAARALLVDLADLPPALGEPILRALVLRPDPGVSKTIDRILESWGKADQRPALEARQRRIATLRNQILTGSSMAAIEPAARSLIASLAQEDQGDWGLALEMLHYFSEEPELCAELIGSIDVAAPMRDALKKRARGSAARVEISAVRVSVEAARDGEEAAERRGRISLLVTAHGGALRPHLANREVAVGFGIEGVGEGGRALLGDFLLPPGGLPEGEALWLSGPLPALSPSAAGKVLRVALLQRGRVLGSAAAVIEF